MANETESTKTYVFGDGGSGGMNAATLMGLMSMLRNNSDPMALLTVARNNGFGGNLGELIVLLVFLGMMGNGFGGNLFGGGNGNGTGAYLGNMISNDNGREVLLQAINGNGQRVADLATTLNCDYNTVYNAVNATQQMIARVESNTGMGFQTLTNAVQAGNTALGQQLCQCCCDMKQLVTSQGYENQIRTLEQTNQLGSKMDAGNAVLAGKIDAQTTMINDRFCQLEMRELQGKIDALRDANNSLKEQVAIKDQNGVVAQMVSQATTPLLAQLNAVAQEVAAIKRCQPPTVMVPDNSRIAVPSIWANAAADLFVDRIAAALAGGGSTSTGGTTTA